MQLAKKVRQEAAATAQVSEERAADGHVVVEHREGLQVLGDGDGVGAQHLVVLRVARALELLDDDLDAFQVLRRQQRLEHAVLAAEVVNDHPQRERTPDAQPA